MKNKIIKMEEIKMKIKLNKLAAVTVVGTTLALTLTGCGGSSDSEQVIKIGVNGTDFAVWNYVKDELAKEEIELEIVSFADYVQPNLALAQGEIDINSFQTQVYFDQFKEDHKLDIIPFGNTVVAPMGIYSEELTDATAIPEKGKVSIPNDLTNGGRALLLLEEVGLITIGEYTGSSPEVKDITENPKNLEIVSMAAQQIPVALGDVELGIINNGIAVTAGLDPVTESIYSEDIEAEHMKSYYNIFAVRAEDAQDEDLKRLVEIYQTDAVKAIIQDTYKGAQIPIF